MSEWLLNRMRQGKLCRLCSIQLALRLCSYLFLIGGAWACIDRIDLPIRSEAPALVVDGQITNEAPPYAVRLSYTGKYGGLTGQNPADQYVNDAQLSLADDQGHLTKLIQAGKGLYQTLDSNFRGQVGRAYSLTVVLADGKRYTTKPERMPPVAPIDSVSARLVETPNPANPYQVAYFITTLDPAKEKNYYRWTAYGIVQRYSQGVACCSGCTSICYNSCWTPVSSTAVNSSAAVNIFADDAFNGNPLRNHFVLQVPIYSFGPQLVEVQQYGLTQANYQFWKLYQQQSARSGSIFDPLPAGVQGNLVNSADPVDLARGYFAVTSVRRKRLRMQTYTNTPFLQAMISFFYNQQLILLYGDCRDIYGPSLLTEPDGWN